MQPLLLCGHFGLCLLSSRKGHDTHPDCPRLEALCIKVWWVKYSPESLHQTGCSSAQVSRQRPANAKSRSWGVFHSHIPKRGVRQSCQNLARRRPADIHSSLKEGMSKSRCAARRGKDSFQTVATLSGILPQLRREGETRTSLGFKPNAGASENCPHEGQPSSPLTADTVSSLQTCEGKDAL